MGKWSKDSEKKLKSWFNLQEASLVDDLDMPFNILKGDAENILQKNSGIIDWQEDLAHLRNQMTREQPGVCLSFDKRQEKRDTRKE